MDNDREISKPLQDLILRCLDKNPKTRITAKELLENAWINKLVDKAAISKLNQP